MLWPFAESLYVLAGGVLAPLLMRMQHPTTVHTASFDPAAALAVVTGTILLWPVLLALAFERGGSR